MPQPFWTKNIHSYITGDITPDRPILAATALRIITTAAETEAAVGRALVALSPKRGRRLARHYNEQESDAKKGATLAAIAAASLEEEDEAIFRRLLAQHRSAQKLRAPFAHWHYAYTDEDPNLLILINPKNELLADAEGAYIQHNWVDEQANPASPDDREAMLEAQQAANTKAIRLAQCYSADELDEIVIRLGLIRTLLDLFQRMITWKGDRLARDAMLRQLEEYLQRME